MLYEHFNETLWKKIAEQDDTFYDEVTTFRQRLLVVTTACFEENRNATSFELPIVTKKRIPQEMRPICEKLLKKDREYVNTLKSKQEQKIFEANRKLIDQRFYRKSDFSRIYYELENSPVAINVTGSTS